jgi:AraC-like DNA-binding protein
MRNTKGIEYLTKSIVMDYLAPLLNQISLSARVFFSGDLCQVVNFDASELAGHVHVMKSGKVAMTVRGKQVATIEKPSVLFFPRPCPHALVPDEKGCELLCASVDLGVRVRSPLAMALPEVLILPMDDMGSVAPTLDLLFSEAFNNEFGRQAALDRIAEYFLIQMLRHVIITGQLQGGIFAALGDSRLAHAVKAMHEKPSHPWTLDELADLSGMSRARFAVNFRETVGITPLDYLTDWRMSVAQNLIKQGRPIKSIAAAVGYQSQAALTRVFLKRVGSSPSDWGKQLNNA